MPDIPGGGSSPIAAISSAAGIGKLLGGLFGGGGHKSTPAQPAKYDPKTGALISPMSYSGGAYPSALRGATATQNFLPAFLNSIYGGAIKTAPDIAGANQDILKQFGPEYAQMLQALSSFGQQSQVGTDTGLLSGSGKDLTAATLENQKIADPEFFNLRSQIGDKSGELIAGQDPNKLSGSEEANVERGNNRSNINSGLANSGSNIGAISNALTFDNKLQQKRDRLTNTLTSIANFAPNLKSGAFNFSAATGQAGAGVGSQTANQFASNTNNIANIGAGLTSNILGQSGAFAQQQNEINVNKIPDWQRIASSVPDY